MAAGVARSSVPLSPGASSLINSCALISGGLGISGRLLFQTPDFLLLLPSLLHGAPNHFLLCAACSVLSIQIRESKQSFQKTYPSALSGAHPHKGFVPMWQAVGFFVFKLPPKSLPLLCCTETQGHPLFMFHADCFSSLLQIDTKVC